MDTSTFAQKIKAKYPAYQSVDDATLVTKFLEKYPEYKSQVNVQSEIAQDISQTGTNIANTVNQGVDKYAQIQARQDAGLQGGLRTKLQQLGVGAGTASGVIGDVIVGAGKTLLPQAAENAVQSGVTKIVSPIVQSSPVQSIISKYEELKTTNPKLAQDIDSLLGVGQLALDVTGVGLGTKGAKVAGKAGIEAVQTGAEQIAKGAGELATGTGKVIESIAPKPEDIMNRVARLSASDARKFESLAGKTHGQYLKETGNFGTPDEIIKKEAEKFAQSINEVDNALASLPGEYKSPTIDVVVQELVDKAKRVSAPGIDSPILSRAVELQNKANTVGLNMSEVNELKRLYERNVKLGYSKLMNPDGVERATNIDNALRNWQFKQAKELGFQNLDELNKQTQLSKFIVDKLGNQILGKSGNNAIGLTDWIMISGGDPTAIGGLLVKKFFSSENVQSKIAKMLTKEAPSELKTATINKPINNIGSEVKGTTRSKPSQQLLEGKQLKKASTTVSKKNGIMSSDLSTGGNNVAYHGTQAKQIVGTPNATDGSMGKAFYVTDNKGKAEVFGKERKVLNDTIINNKGKKVKQYVREPNYYKTSNVFDINLDGLNIKEFKDSTEFFKYISNSSKKEIPDWFKLSGYDGAYIKDSGTYAIYSPEKIKMPKANKK